MLGWVFKDESRQSGCLSQPHFPPLLNFSQGLRSSSCDCGPPVPPSSLCPWRSEPLQGCDGHGLPLLSVPGALVVVSWLSGSTGLSFLRHTANVPGSVLPLVMYLFSRYSLRSSPPVLVPLCLQVCSLYLWRRNIFNAACLPYLSHSLLV